jgi:4-hydroxymandelate oxidase
MTLMTIADYEARARQLLPALDFAEMFADSGGAPQALINNVAAFLAIELRPRVMVDVSQRDISTEVLGQPITLPVLLAPTGGLSRMHEEGELLMARAAKDAGTIGILSTASSRSMEDVAEAGRGSLWFQLYIQKDRLLTEDLIRRAELNGYRALVITVDNQAYRSPERDVAHTSAGMGTELGNFDREKFPNAPTVDTYQDCKAQDFTWNDLAWLRSKTSLPIVIKGIQNPVDMVLACRHGVDGVVVSNHGGYALRSAPATMAVLPEIVQVAGEVEVFVDGGVRSGTDVLRALAVGARAVLVGRPHVWGAAVSGEAGVRHILQILRDELWVATGVCGVTDVRNVDPSLAHVPLARSAVGGLIDGLASLGSLANLGVLTSDEVADLKTALLAKIS